MMLATMKSQTFVCSFPDVCIWPSPPTGLVPVPYPNLATIATSKQAKKQVASKPAIGTKTTLSRSSGDEVGAGTSVASYQMKKMSEAQMLRNSLGVLTTQLQQMTSTDADVWGNAVGQIAVVASALFMTLTD
jgi:hypothetical protein